jgi:hypothetical protein
MEGDWDFYEASMDDERAFVMLDLAAEKQESHPHRLQIRVKMQKPRPDGLRSNEEAEALFALEDKVTDAMATTASAIFVARIVAQGYSEMIFYLPDPARAENPPQAVGDVAPYNLEWFVEEDSEWEKYQELYPNVYAMQTITNRRLLRQMMELGDQIQVPREIDHLALFPTEENAKQASAQLVERGFRVDEIVKDDRERWSLQFHRDDACDDGKPDQFVFEILDVILPLDGDYDGWGSMLVKG